MKWERADYDTNPVTLAKKLLDPAIGSLSDGMSWIPESAQWEREPR